MVLTVGLAFLVMEPEYDVTLSDNLKKALKNRSKVTWKLEPEILIAPSVPHPLHRLVPRELKGASWWQATRKAAFASTDYHCQACGIHKTCARYHQWLEGHEMYRINYVKGLATYTRTVPLCHFCHNYIHAGRLKSLLDKGQVHHAKYAAILQHGDEVLAKYNIVRPAPYDGLMAQWGKWRLVLDRKRYKPLYKSYDEWKIAHA